MRTASTRDRLAALRKRQLSSGDGRDGSSLRLRSLAELGELALSEQGLEDFPARLVEIVATALGVEGVLALEYIRDGDLTAPRASHGANELGPAAASPDPFTRFTLLSVEPVVVPDLSRERRFSMPPALVELGLKSAANVRVPRLDGTWGVLGIRSARELRPGSDEIEFLRTAAAILGSAMERREQGQSLVSVRHDAAISNERLSAVVDASPLAVMEVDLDGRVMVWNRSSEEMFGWTREEVLGQRLPTIPEHLAGELEELIARAAAGERIIGYETERLRRDGTLFPYSLSLATHRDLDGNLIGIIGHGSDVSERKLAEEELSRSRELYRVVVENSHDMVAVLDPMGRFVFASPSYEQVLGYSPDELVGVSPISLVHPGDVQRASDALRQVVTSQNAAVVELRMRHKRGNWVFVEGTTTSVLHEDGQLRSILMSFRDISERRIAEEELREAEARYRLLVEQLPLVTYISVPGTSRRWVYLSPQLEEMLGYKASDWTSDFNNYLQAIHPDDRARTTSERAAATGKGRIAIEYRLIAADGRTVWVRDDAVVVRDLSGKPLYVQGYLLDISAERQAEAERRQLEAQLLHSQKMEAIGRLAGGIAHDFNNLLTAITGYSELIISELEPDSSLSRDAEEIKNAAEQAAAMTQQLLAFSRRQVLQPALLNPNEVIEHMEKLLRRLIGEHIELVTELSEDVDSIRSDRSQIEQVMMNLVVNARDAMPDGGRIMIETGNVEVDTGRAAALGLEPGRYVMASVADSGSGMDDETMTHIFEPFFTTKGQGEGTGLGLATVHGIVEQSNGAIQVTSNVGEGSEFRVYLPVAVGGVAADRQPMPSGETHGTETLLLVEDEETVRQLVARVLRELGYDVHEKSSGEEALSFSTSFAKPIDLLLTDVVMPGMNGRELAELLTVSRPSTKVLFMSGYTEEAIVHHGVPVGEATFIGKPFTPQELARKVRSVLESSAEDGEGEPADRPAVEPPG